MISQLLKQIWVERRANVWLLLELFGMFVCLFAMIDFFYVKWSNYTEPMGYDIENTYRLNMKILDDNSPIYVDKESITETKTEEVQKLMTQIRQHPDVEAVSFSFFSNPYYYSGFMTMMQVDTVTPEIRVRGRWVTPEYFDVFRVKNHNGENIQIPEGMNRQVVLSEKTAKNLFRSANDATGKLIYGGYGDAFILSEHESTPAQVVAVSRDFKIEEFGTYSDCFFEILNPVRLNIYIADSDVRTSDICLRVREGRAKHFEESFQEEMGDRLRVNNLYVASITSFDQLRDDMIGKTIRENINMMLYITLFALVTVSLGIFGSFWLRSRQRRSEIGIRMAMGADKTAIRKEMIAESLFLMTIAMLPAFIIYINLLFAEVMDIFRLAFTPGRVAIVLFITLFGMASIIIISTLWPANRAASIQAVDALRDE